MLQQANRVSNLLDISSTVDGGNVLRIKDRFLPLDKSNVTGSDGSSGRVISQLVAIGILIDTHTHVCYTLVGYARQ